jgi:hypothetical protein
MYWIVGNQPLYCLSKPHQVGAVEFMLAPWPVHGRMVRACAATVQGHFMPMHTVFWCLLCSDFRSLLHRWTIVLPGSFVLAVQRQR